MVVKIQKKLNISTENSHCLRLRSECAVPEKNPYPPHGRSSEIPRGGGSEKTKF